jgi:hypothetical protein
MKSSWTGSEPRTLRNVVVVLPGAREADDECELLLAVRRRVRRERLRARVHGEAAPLVDEAVPHAQAAHLRLTEVVRAHDAGRPLVEVDEDQALLVVLGDAQARGVDDGELRGPGLVAREVQLVLHGDDVRVALLHVQARTGAERRVGADVALQLDHVLLCDVGVLLRGVGLGLGTGHALLAVVLVGDEEGRRREPGEDAGGVVEVAELGLDDARHVLQDPGAELLLRRVHGDAACGWERCGHRSTSGSGCGPALVGRRRRDRGALPVAGDAPWVSRGRGRPSLGQWSAGGPERHAQRRMETLASVRGRPRGGWVGGPPPTGADGGRPRQGATR